ncbi:hypothetical protein AAG570_012969 [Ranatra chinensis]|uniref:J domain-containing protein n=1 Tax=Ranatra chinensis TaxID=642074 RepID=A0ABD0YFQ0_9HEMI
MPLPDNNDLVCFYVTKHSSWRGRYKRVFSIGTNGISTYEPENLETTNRWPYNDVINLKPLADSKFSIIARKDKTKRAETMTFSTEHRSDLLTFGLSYFHSFSENVCDSMKYEAHKQHWSGTRLPVLLDVTPSSLDQLDTATNSVLASYYYKDIESLQDVDDVTGGFIVTCKQFGRMHLFICGNREDMKHKVQRNAQLYIGVDIRLQNKPVSLDYFLKNRLGKFSEDEDTTSLIEFTVEKVGSKRHQDSTQRLLCLTQTCLLERDPETYNVVTLRPLATIFAFIRDPENPRQFTVEHSDLCARTYQGPNRDSILATLLEAVRAAGNKDVHVKMKPTARGKRLGPYHVSLDEEVESIHLRLLKQNVGKKVMSEMIERFNCNVPYSGLLHSVTQDGIFKDNKERPIIEALQAITVKHKEGLLYDPDSLCEEEVEALFQLIRRLVASKIGFGAFTQLLGFRDSLGFLVLKGLKRDHEAITHAAIDMICALMHPMHDDYDLKQEQLNKSSLLSNVNFLSKLLDNWIHHVEHSTGALVVSAMLDMLTFALCLPFSETTEGKHFDALLDLVAKRGRSLFKHFQHPCVTIVKGAGLIMQAVIEEGDLDIATCMQELSLSEGALPRHLLSALFTPISDRYHLAQCHLSRHLVGLWLTNNANGNDLIRRIFPSGLLSYLESTDKVPAKKEELTLTMRDNLKLAQDHSNRNHHNQHLVSLERQLRIVEKHLQEAFVHWGAKFGLEKRQDKLKLAPVVLRKSRQRIKSTANWPLFYYNFNIDHSLPNLIWNHKTRDELRSALEKEVRAFESDREVSRYNVIAWNYAEFEVSYSSLKDQLCIDGYYIKILLDKQEAPESLMNISSNFFNNLYHRFLLASASDMKCMCLQALAIVYGRFFSSIGHFPDTKFIVSMLERTFDRLERDRLLLFIYKLSLNQDNVKDILDCNGVTILIDLMTLAHLHKSRAVVPTQTNVIEAGDDMLQEQEQEWHYCNSADVRQGPFTFNEIKELHKKDVITHKTKCWAQGMDSWRTMQNICQLKWCLLARGNPVMNESELTILILNVFITMSEYYPSRNSENAVIWPMSRLKQALSSQHNINHIVQLLLTFDPVIVEKVATLLCYICTDNTQTPKIYLTGVFYFILMYTGSNVRPIAKFLQLTHTKQAFRGDDITELMQKSILGQLLPEAMINYLENYGEDKFAHIFLGEFDTPEVIWNSEMRRMLIQKIATHLADFTPRLCCNNRAPYQYASIPVVRYPQLHNELFCNIYYLRHLCDTARFPDWPISEPVELLRDVLEAWKTEVEKKPPVMSINEANAALELPEGQHHDEQTIRKAYYRLAQIYHPDKNTAGREKFEMVNKAYEFLCSRNLWMDNGVNTNNILLILQTQSILFQRYPSDLKPYKYAGYKQLIKTIQLETNDERLFSKQTLLLPAASELIYYTIKCSSLNAEELNRENGFEVVLGAYSRCVSLLTESTNDGDVIAQICLNCTKCFTIAAAFSDCRNSFVRMPQLISDLVRILHFKGIIRLCCAVVNCISAFSMNSDLQLALLQSGILWYLITYLFSYDYTLEECGIERSQESNQQEAWNEIAKLSVGACARLAGYLDSDPQSPHAHKVRSVLDHLLTPYLAKQFANEQPHQLLKMLTCNSENPYLLWNNSTRAELLEFLEKQQSFRGQHSLDNVVFTFSCYKQEIIVGGIFIRVYNEQPSYPIEDPRVFVLDLLDYLDVHKNKSQTDEGYQHCVMVLDSLYNVIDNNAGVEIQCIGRFKLLFLLLNDDSSDEIHAKVLSILTLVTKNQECINDISASGVFVHLLLVMHNLPSSWSLTLTVLHALSTSSSIVKEFYQKGGIFYLLNIILNSNSYDLKVKATEAFGKIIDDKISGPKVRLALNHILPSAICDAMRDNSSSAVKLLHTDQENPEIIWNEAARAHISALITQRCREQYTLQRKDPESVIQPIDSSIISVYSSNELVVGGVYIHLYNSNPAWKVRKPTVFLTELFDAFVKHINKFQVSSLESIGTALTNLLTYDPSLADHVPSLGHLPKLCSQWKTSVKQLTEYIFKVLHMLANNEVYGIIIFF